MAGNSRSLLDVILGRTLPVDSAAGNAFYFAQRSSVSSSNITAENSLQNPTVLSCVNLISQGIAQLNWGIHDIDDMFINDHMLNGILNRPNQFQTSYEFKSAIIQDMLTHGNSYTRVVRSPNGRVLNLIPMDPSKMSVNSNAAGIPVYEHEKFGIMTAQEVVHVRDVAGHDVNGKSRVLYAGERIEALNNADQLMAETFINGVNINYSVELDGTMDDTSRNKLYSQLKSAFGKGGSRRGGVAVIEGGKMTSLKGSTPADADLRALRGNLIDEIAALFRVPASLVGGSSGETFNNVTARLASMYRDTYQPLITNIEQAFSNSLTTNGNRVVFDVSTLVKGDLMSQVTIATTASGGAAFMTQNEARVFIGFQPLSAPEGTEGSNPYDMLPSTAAPAQAETDDRRGEGDTDEGNLGDQPDAEEE